MHFSLVIFDCDGVLVDSEPIANRVLAAYVTELGRPMTTEESIRIFVGHTMPEVAQIAGDYLGRPAPVDFLDELQRRSEKAFERELKPIPGIEELLSMLRVPFCVASNGTLAKMRSTLGVTGLLPQFEAHMLVRLHTVVNFSTIAPGEANVRINGATRFEIIAVCFMYSCFCFGVRPFG